MESVNISKNIPVTDSADVLVCGAGPAGWIAALSAARRGCSVILVDKYGFIGGTATASYVLPISGYYLKKPTESEVYERYTCVSELPLEFAHRLEEIGGASFDFPRGNISFDPEKYKYLAQKMLDEAGVRFLPNSFICDIIRDGNTVTHVIITNKSGMQAIKAKIVIDASGDADIFRMAGAEMQPINPDMQPMSLCFLLDNVDYSTSLLRDKVRHDAKGGIGSQCDILHDYLLSCPELDSFCGPWVNSTVSGNTLAVNITRISCDALDAKAFAAAEKKLREDMFTVVGLLKKKFPEFADCVIVSSGINAGIRETRRILGRETLTEDVFLRGEPVKSPAALCAHPIDIHHPHGGGQTLVRLSRPGIIPFGCLVNSKNPNLIAAGRSVSCDPAAIASARVQGTCMTMGDTAGAAAAFALANKCNVNEADLCGFVFEDLEKLQHV